MSITEGKYLVHLPQLCKNLKDFGIILNKFRPKIFEFYEKVWLVLICLELELANK